MAAATLAVLIPTAPAEAFTAATFKGKTSQERPVVVRVGATGHVEQIRIGWATRCRRGRLGVRTRFIVGRSGTRRRLAFRDKARSRQRGGVVITYRSRIRARRVTSQRWKGVFIVRAVVRRRGRTLDRCHLRPVRWIATVAVAKLSFEGGSVQGGSRSYSAPEQRISVDATRGTINVRTRTWALDIDAPGKVRLRRRRYDGARRYPFNFGRPGLAFSGEGHGCNEVFGSFDIDALSFDRRGLKNVSFTFEHHCETPNAAALRGRFTFRNG